MKGHIPYRITIEIATPGKGKSVVLTGATPDRRAGIGDPTDVELCQMAHDVLRWQGERMGEAGKSRADFEAVETLVNMPVTGRVN